MSSNKQKKFHPDLKEDLTNLDLQNEFLLYSSLNEFIIDMLIKNYIAFHMAIFMK
jgi:hypothetical protein